MSGKCGVTSSNPEQEIKDQLKRVEADIDAVIRTEVLASEYSIPVSNTQFITARLLGTKLNLEGELDALKKPTTEEVAKALKVLEAYFGAK